MKFRRLFSLIKKDLKIQFKNKFALFFFLGLPLIYLVFFNFIGKKKQGHLEIYCQKELSSQFADRDTVYSEYMGVRLPLAVKYIEKNELINQFNKGEITAAFYKENDEIILNLNTNRKDAQQIYNSVREYFYPIMVHHFKLRKIFSMQYILFGIVFNFLLLYSSLNYGSSLLSRELLGHNILFLKKSGLSNLEIIFSKALTVLVMQYAVFTVFIIIGKLMNMLEGGYQFYIYIPLIVLPSAVVGLFVSSITKSQELRGILPVFLWFPTIFYSMIKDDVSFFTKMLFLLDPLVTVSEFIEQVQKGNPNLDTMLLIAGFTVVFSIVGALFLKRTIIKSL